MPVVIQRPVIVDEAEQHRDRLRPIGEPLPEFRGISAAARWSCCILASWLLTGRFDKNTPATQTQLNTMIDSGAVTGIRSRVKDLDPTPERARHGHRRRARTPNG